MLIQTELNRYGDQLDSNTLHVTGIEGFNLCSLHVIPEGQSGRQVMHGPLIPGPWAFVCQHALVIDNHGGSARERDRAIQIEAGQEFQIEGCPGTYHFRAPDRYKWEGEGPVLVRATTDQEDSD